MPIFLNTLGNPTLGIGLCDRCHEKFPLGDLKPDRNTPGLMVCDNDNDEYDPYRLPALMDDRLNLPFVRPDVDIAVAPPPTLYDPFRVTEADEYRVTPSDPADDDQSDDYRTVKADS